jgi:hypothetical protein
MVFREQRRGLRESKAIGRLLSLGRLKTVRINNHLAHSLSATATSTTVALMQPGDEVKLLHLWVNGRGFLFDDSREMLGSIAVRECLQTLQWINR